jgi:ATP-dependent helicase HrpA
MNAKKLQQQIFQHCTTADRRALLRLLNQLRRHPSADTEIARLEQAVAQSVARVQRRQQRRPSISLNKELPFYEKRDELKQIIADNQVVIVCGETGSGKTTQLPQICIDLGLADKGKIGHTQPRRLAARAVTNRIAEELKTKPGEAVGYKVRFTDTTKPDSYVKLMTDGILLAEIQGDNWLNEYQTLIIDEAHERSLNIDLILGFVKQLLPKRPDLKLIITSATIDPQRFSKYFDDAPMVMVSGRTYPVDVRYRPIIDEEQKDRDRSVAVMDALEELFAIGAQDTLVFFSGERQIREAAEKISKRFHQCEVLPLFARLSNEQQQRIFKKSRRPKIILSTNVAETSLTVPGIRYVIDTGLARLSRYSWRSRVQRLPIEKISQASANQRAGRCGRVAPGICIRLYDEEDFNNRAEFTEPEILRTNLASVILQMDSLRVGHIGDFDFIEPPDSRLIKDGYRLLHELQAVKANDQVTPMGKTISRLPIDPRLARMLIEAKRNGCVTEVLIIAAVLSVQDPRDQSQEKRQQANEKFKLWQHEKSDFLGWIKLWNEIDLQKRSLSNNQFAKWCKKNFLSWLRVREWQDIYQQIQRQLKELKFAFNSAEASEEAIHRSILLGIPSHIAAFDQDREYQTTRGRKTQIFPSSVLAKKTPKWIMAFSLIDTSRLYAHVVAGMNPQWAISDLQHLHQYEYYEPHWQETQGRVAALRNTRIYGLLVEGGRRVNYASVNPKESREIFIREALVEGRMQTRVDFVRANRKLIDFYREQEERERRRDLLIGDEQVYQFYDRHVPESVVDKVSFESWVKKVDTDQLKQLTLFADDVLKTGHEKDTQTYPEFLHVKNQQLKLSYVFDPADEADGVTVHIPLAVLNQFDDADFDYLVPGLLQEKIQALLKALPKQVRKNFIPVPDFAAACFEALDVSKPLYSQLSQQLQRMTGVSVDAALWQPNKIDRHFQMRYCLQQNGRCKVSSRSLDEIKDDYAIAANRQFEQQVQQSDGITREGLQQWNFDDLPDSVTLNRNGGRITAFPALVDYEESVAIELFETRADADFYHPSGCARLIAFRLDDVIKYCRKNLPHFEQSALMYISFGSKQELFEDIMMASIESCFLVSGAPRNQEQFEALLDKNKPRFLALMNEKSERVHKILSLYRAMRNTLDEAAIAADHLADCREQCEYLVYAGFVRDTPDEYLIRLPVYFQALQKRLQKMQQDATQANRMLPLIRDCWQQYLLRYERGADAEQLQKLRWMIEEFRINCFAQPMKTRVPVSENKIRKLIAQIK